MNYEHVLTTCPYCGCGCGLFLEVVDQQVTGCLPSRTSPVNQGSLCLKGWNAHEFVHSPQRLTQPMVRKKGELQKVSWDEALDYTVSRIQNILETYDSDSLAFLASAKFTTEENYLIQKLARAVIGTNNIDHCARL